MHGQKQHINTSLFAHGQENTVTLQYQQQQPADNASTKVSTVREKGHHYTAAACGVFLCHDIIH